MTDTRSRFDGWHAQVPKSIKRPAVIGLAVLIVAFLGFGVWAGTAPINSAVIASGKFVATGQNKIIQHLEGGIVDKILVKEGDVVAIGQTLVRLDDTAAKAQLRRLDLKGYRLLALQARLEAERRSLGEVTFSDVLLEQMTSPEVLAIIEGQKIEFQVRKDATASQIKVLEQRIAAIGEEITGLLAQRNSSSAQLDLILQEIKGQDELFKKGLTRLTTVLALKRAKAKLEGDRGEAIANIGRAKERITEIEGQIVHLKAKRIEESVAQLRNVETELDDVEERIKAARDVLARLEIRAPVKGVVVKLSQHTPGGIIAPGREILELLPIEEKLLIEAFVRPEDIDVVRKGNKAQLRLIALKQRVTPMVSGRVIYVSADSIEGTKQGEVFYVARIAMDEDKVTEIKDFKQAPGMPVEVYIETGERTFFEYLVSPISDSFSRAFREN